MLIAAASLALVVASAAVPAAEALPSSPVMPLVVSVTAAADISPSLVRAVLHEADAVWRVAGFRFTWQIDAPALPSMLRVIIGGGTSSGVNRLTPLAWVTLAENGMPEPKVYVSHANALKFLKDSRGVVGLVDTMPVAQRDAYLARVLGRALAHEVGHYLMGSKLHTARGLMRAEHTSAEFFGPERDAFRIDANERQRMAARFASIYMASRG
jgi:hypothetical protein